MQSPMMIAFVQSRGNEWQRDQPPEHRQAPVAHPGRSPIADSPVIRIGFVVLLLGALLALTSGIASATAVPTCLSQAAGASIRPDLPAPLLGACRRARPVHPPPAAADATSFRIDLPELEALWAVVFELVPSVAEIITGIQPTR